MYWKNSKILTYYPSRLNTGPKTGASGSFFIQAKPGTKYRTIYKKKMGESSFNLKDESVNKTIQGSNQAYSVRYLVMNVR